MSRKLAREAAFKALFQLDFNFEDGRREYFEDLAIRTSIGETLEDDAAHLSTKDTAYIESSVKGSRDYLEEIDKTITDHLKEGWQLSRLMAADRNILRLAVYEMKFVEPTIPKGVAINEAIELAKKYGTDDSSRFVNGILEAISK